MSERYRGIEQLVARRAHNPEVVGSSPSPATKQIPKNGLTPPFLGIFPLQKTRPKPGDFDFDPCLTHTGFFTEQQRGRFGLRCYWLRSIFKKRVTIHCYPCSGDICIRFFYGEG